MQLVITSSLHHQVIEEDGLQQNAARVGEVFIKELMKLQDEFEVIGDVRGKGLMIGVDLVKNRVSTIREKSVVIIPCRNTGNMI